MATMPKAPPRRISGLPHARDPLAGQIVQTLTPSS